VEAAAAPGAPPRAAEAVERVLRPYATPDGPFATLGGWADVLCGVARERPGAGVALALDAALAAAGDGSRATSANTNANADADANADERYEPRTTALSAWRAHARAVHDLLDGVDDTTTGRYEGLFVARAGEVTPGRARTAARLLRDFRSPEPATLVAGDGAVAAAATDRERLDAIAGALATAAGGAGGDPDDRGRARVAVGGDRTAAAGLDGDAGVREALAAAREAAG
ncbi:MAG: hypothetical protein ABEH47_03235, partial [Haloferacaceae archaeon]